MRKTYLFNSSPAPKSSIFPCWYCKHPDCRDATHARGCPELPPVTKERMLEIALACERGWRIEL